MPGWWSYSYTSWSTSPPAIPESPSTPSLVLPWFLSGLSSSFESGFLGFSSSEDESFLLGFFSSEDEPCFLGFLSPEDDCGLSGFLSLEDESCFPGFPPDRKSVV